MVPAPTTCPAIKLNEMASITFLSNEGAAQNSQRLCPRRR
jgi:hypothetical protein